MRSEGAREEEELLLETASSGSPEGEVEVGGSRGAGLDEVERAWVRVGEGRCDGRLGEIEKASSCCSSTGRSTANLCTPITMVSGALGTYCGPWSALWRGRKETVRVRTTPWESGEVLLTLHSLKAELPRADL